MQKEFSRRDFLKGMAVVTASGLLVACGGGNGTRGGVFGFHGGRSFHFQIFMFFLSAFHTGNSPKEHP